MENLLIIFLTWHSFDFSEDCYLIISYIQQLVIIFFPHQFSYFLTPWHYRASISISTILLDLRLLFVLFSLFVASDSQHSRPYESGLPTFSIQYSLHQSTFFSILKTTSSHCNLLLLMSVLLYLSLSSFFIDILIPPLQKPEVCKSCGNSYIVLVSIQQITKLITVFGKSIMTAK